MRSWVPGNLGRRRLPARPEGEARPRCSCLVGKSPGKSRGGLAAAGVGDLNPAPSCFHIQGRRGGCRVTCDSCAPGRDRSCPLRTSGSRCRADLARTRATTITAGSGPVRSRTPAALRSSATRNRIGQPGTARPIPLLGKWWTSCPWSTNTSPPWMQFSRNLPRGRDAQPSNHPAMERYLPHWRASMVGAAVGRRHLLPLDVFTVQRGEDEYGLLLNC
jgi:hypothetical protein